MALGNQQNNGRFEFMRHLLARISLRPVRRSARISVCELAFRLGARWTCTSMSTTHAGWTLKAGAKVELERRPFLGRTVPVASRSRAVIAQSHRSDLTQEWPSSSSNLRPPDVHPRCCRRHRGAGSILSTRRKASRRPECEQKPNRTSEILGVSGA